MNLANKLKKYDHPLITSFVKALELGLEDSVRVTMLSQADKLRSFPKEAIKLLITELFDNKGIDWPYSSFRKMF